MATKKIKKQEKKQENKKHKRGRPIKENEVVEEQGICEYWFQVPLVLRLVQLIGSQGQILFKSLSGQKAYELKNELEKPNHPKDSQEAYEKKQQFLKLKEKRQLFLKSLNELQTEFLNSKYEKQPQGREWAYLLIKKSDVEQSVEQSVILEKIDKNLKFIVPLLDKNFFESFVDIISGKSIEELLNYETHKTLNLWALIKSINDEAYQLREKIQKFDDQNKIEINNLIKQIDDTIKQQKETFQTDIEILFYEHKYDRRRIIEILMNRIKLVISQEQQNNSETQE